MGISILFRRNLTPSHIGYGLALWMSPPSFLQAIIIAVFITCPRNLNYSLKTMFETLTIHSMLCYAIPVRTLHNFPAFFPSYLSMHLSIIFLISALGLFETCSGLQDWFSSLPSPSIPWEQVALVVTVIVGHIRHLIGLRQRNVEVLQCVELPSKMNCPMFHAIFKYPTGHSCRSCL